MIAIIGSSVASTQNVHDKNEVCGGEGTENEPEEENVSNELIVKQTGPGGSWWLFHDMVDVFLQP